MKIAFQGEVHRQTTDTGRLWLRGLTRASGPAATWCDTDAIFYGADLPSLPDKLDQVQVIELGAASDTPRRFQLQSGQLQAQFTARSAQLQRAAGAAMFAAVPPAAVPWHLRAGWSLLLSLLRIPGIGRLLLRDRVPA
jgi:hypothetical protein